MNRDTEIKIHTAYNELWNIEKLKPNSKNPNTHPENQIKRLAKIIQKQGWRTPITVSKRSGLIVRGHARLKAAQLLELKQVPVDLQDYESDELELADLVADNRIAELAEIDNVILKDLLEEIDTGQLDDIEITGFDEKEIEALFCQFHIEAEEDDFDADAEAEKIVEPKSKLGQIFKLGDRHKLMCGDSTKLEDVKRLMNGELADITFTSPPYNAATTPTELKSGKKSKYESDLDNKSHDDYLSFLTDSTNNSLLVSIYSFFNIQSIAGNKLALIDYLHNMRDVYADTIIWDKLSAQPAMCKNVLNSQFEYVHIFSSKANRSVGVKEFRGDISNIISITKQTKNKVSNHNATFPVELAAFFINKFTISSVLDLFGGSGSTLIAAEQLNRRAFLMEISPRYCDVIIERYKRFKNLPDEWWPEID